MITDFSTVAHLYLGCRIQHPDGSIAELFGVVDKDAHFVNEQTNQCGFCSIDSPLFGKPIFRKLESMSEEEMKELLSLWHWPSDDIFRQENFTIKFYPYEPHRNINRGNGIGYSLFRGDTHIQTGTLSFSRLNAAQFLYLLSKHFDLFNLIDNNLAIDKSKQ